MHSITGIFARLPRPALFSVCCLLAATAAAAGGGCFRPGALWPDNNGVHINAHGAGLYAENGVYYWFGEHKIAGRAGNVAHVGVHCYSSTNLYDWKDEGIALKVSDDPASPIVKECIIEKPKVIYNKKTKKYVMWFHLEGKGRERDYRDSKNGVAVADAPAGPYRFLRAGRMDAGIWPADMPEEERRQGLRPRGGNDPYAFVRRDFKGGQMARDMTVFVDDDGKAYHFFASEENRTLHIAELTDDYLRHTGKYVRAFRGRYMEAPAVCKKDGYYYLIMSGCTSWAPNKARSAYAKNIMGPWTELENPCVGPGSELTFGGQSACILPVDRDGRTVYLFIGDIWRPKNAIDGRYMWLPIEWEGHQMVIKWRDEWRLETYLRGPAAPQGAKP